MSIRVRRLLSLSVCLALVLTAVSVAPANAAVTQGGTCNSFAKAVPLGNPSTSYTDSTVAVPTCGPLPADNGGTGPKVLPYPGAASSFQGYQCVEFSERYLHYKFGVAAIASTNGAQVVDHYVKAYSTKFQALTGGTAATAPRVGDVVSFSKVAAFNDTGHTGVVAKVTINSTGSGSIVLDEQNYRGGTGRSGYSSIPVVGWKLSITNSGFGFAYAKWLDPIVNIPDAALKACIDQEYQAEFGEAITEINAAQLGKIRELRCFNVLDLTGLESAKSLTVFMAAGCSQVGSLKPLTGLTNLTTLNVDGNACPGMGYPPVYLTDLSPVKGLKNLTSAIISGYFTDVSPFANLTKLTSLQISGSFTDISSLSNLAKHASIFAYSEPVLAAAVVGKPYVLPTVVGIDGASVTPGVSSEAPDAVGTITANTVMWTEAGSGTGYISWYGDGIQAESSQSVGP